MTSELLTFAGSSNLFRDLGFPEAEAAQRAGITQPRMNDLIKNRTYKFTLDALVNVAAKLGYTVKLSLKKAA